MTNIETQDILLFLLSFFVSSLLTMQIVHLSLNSISIQVNSSQLRLRLALFSANLATHPSARFTIVGQSD